MSEEISTHGCYQYNKDTRAYIEAVEKRHSEEFKEIRQDLKALANRLPVWATLFISFLTLMLGAFAAKVVW